MLADWILQLYGEDPTLISDGNKWPFIFADAVFYGWPFFLLLLFLTPFGFVWWKYRRFSLKSLVVAFVVGVILAGAGVYGLVWGFAALQGLAARDIYGF